jgi:hypothetical protein
MIVLHLNIPGEDIIEHTNGKCHEMKLIFRIHEAKELIKLKIHHDEFEPTYLLEWWIVVQLKGSMV